MNKKGRKVRGLAEIGKGRGSRLSLKEKEVSCLVIELGGEEQVLVVRHR